MAVSRTLVRMSTISHFHRPVNKIENPPAARRIDVIIAFRVDTYKTRINTELPSLTKTISMSCFTCLKFSSARVVSI